MSLKLILCPKSEAVRLQWTTAGAGEGCCGGEMFAGSGVSLGPVVGTLAGTAFRVKKEDGCRRKMAVTRELS